MSVLVGTSGADAYSSSHIEAASFTTTSKILDKIKIQVSHRI
jgi:hypothetical protein